VILVAVIWIPLRLGGYGAIFAAADRAFAAKGGATGLTLSGSQMLPYSLMALGSALAGFMYPHAMTGVLGSSSARTIRLNAILLPAFTVLLGLIALLGYMAIAAGIHVENSSLIVPALFDRMFPQWFVGFSFAAIVIGALVPAAIMAIASATICTRNIGKAFLFPAMTPAVESKWAKRISVLVLFASLSFVILLPTQYAIDLQLIGGIWILQIFPAVVLGLGRGRLHASALLVGWLAGMILGTWLTMANGLKPVLTLSMGGSSCQLYIGMITLVLNLAISLAGSGLLNISGRASAPADVLAPEELKMPLQ
jgi:SSS family solute:Na+ symporter